MRTISSGGFDRLAPFYDSLADLVFGASLQRAQLSFLDRIPAGSRVLVLGGGTGRWLPLLWQLQPVCEIWFVEPSVGMLSRARRNASSNQRIDFINSSEIELSGSQFDVIITHFFLDLFEANSLPAVIERIVGRSSNSLQWIVTDFVDHGKKWERLLLFIMYSFFRAVCKIEAKSLPSWKQLLEDGGLRATESKGYFKGFIQAVLFVRTPSSAASS